jgi:hypothetical protein
VFVMNKTSLIGASCICFLASISSANADTIDVMFGDIDGFGFTSVLGLEAFTGEAADRNGSGILDGGDSLPQLGVPEAPAPDGIHPAADDFFDNQTVGDPSITDIGFTALEPLDIGFTYTIPENHVVTSAVFSIVGGDFSYQDRLAHVLSVDGQVTTQILDPAGTDGEITLTEFIIDASLLNLFNDGSVIFSLDFDSPSDDIAIDYGQLVLETDVSAVPVPASVFLLGSGLIGLVGVARRKKI